jgi:hypothetical protein
LDVSIEWLKGNRSQQLTHAQKSMPADVNAAISAAIFMYLNEMHDDEKQIITIKKVAKTYTPWNSKIYGLNNLDYKKNL